MENPDERDGNTNVCDGDDCERPPEEKLDENGCYPDPEFAKDVLVTNLWETGQIWGEIFANMF
jgi:hypothetical protein